MMGMAQAAGVIVVGGTCSGRSANTGCEPDRQ
jgi:hypothetical protein